MHRMRVVSKRLAESLPSAELGNPPVGKNIEKVAEGPILLATGAKLTHRRVGSPFYGAKRYVVYGYDEKSIKELGL